MEQNKIEDLADELWFELADESDGWQTTMNYKSFKKAINKALNIPVVSESLQVGTFLIQKVTKNDHNNSDNIIFVTNRGGEGTDIDIQEVFNEKL